MIFFFYRGLLCIFQIFFNEVFYFHKENTNIFFKRRKYLVTRQLRLKLLTNNVVGTGMCWPPTRSPWPAREGGEPAGGCAAKIPPRAQHTKARMCGASGPSPRLRAGGFWAYLSRGRRTPGSKQQP